MTSLPITPPSAARVATAPKGSSPPTAPPGDFAALLDQTTARTAPAEGPKTRPARHEQGLGRREDRVDRGRDDEAHAAKAAREAHDADTAAAPQPDATPGDATAPPAADGQAQQPAADETPAPAPVPAPADDPAAAAAAAQAAAVQAAADETAAAPGGQAAVPATEAPATAGQAVAPNGVPAGPEAVAGDAPAGAAADAAPGGALQIPAELLAAKGAAAKHGKAPKDGAAAQGELPPLPTLPPSASAAATAATATAGGPGADAGAGTPGDGHPAPPPPAPAPAPAGPPQHAAAPQAPPAGAGGFSATPALSRGSVVQTAERVQELVRIATTRAGNARATLQLRPEALGQVDVQLRTTRDGLVATIAAHDRAGLDALQQAGSELRRMLEDRGVELHSLDLQLGAGADGGFANQGDARQASSGRGPAATTYALDEDDDVVAEDELTITTGPSAPAGALVDVTA